MRIMNKAGKILIIFGIMAFLGSVGSGAITLSLAVSTFFAPATRAAAATQYIYHVTAKRDTPSGSHGVGARITVEQPVVKDKDGWSIAQILIGDGQIGAIEFGWFVASSEPKPHLFLVVRMPDGEYHLIHNDGEYGFHAVGTVKPDADISADLGTSEIFHIGYYADNNAWWIQYKDKWIGWIDATYFSPVLKTAAAALWYGEVGSNDSQYPCTQMGNGTLGTSAGSAQFIDMFYEDDSQGLVPANAKILPYDRPPAGSVAWNSDPNEGGNVVSHFSYGGPGYCAS